MLCRRLHIFIFSDPLISQNLAMVSENIRYKIYEHIIPFSMVYFTLKICGGGGILFSESTKKFF